MVKFYLYIVLIFYLASMIFSNTMYSQKPENYDNELKGMYNNTVSLITPTELSEQIESDVNIIILDTREKNEFKVSHLKDARYVGYNGFTMNAVKDIPKDAEIVLYCSLGVRSEKIGEQLLQAGYTNVRNLYGGIFEWVYEGNEIVDKSESKTSKVHTYDENWSKWLLEGEKVY